MIEFKIYTQISDFAKKLIKQKGTHIFCLFTHEN